MNELNELKTGLETAFVDGNVVSNTYYRPQFISNNNKEGRKVISSVESELANCDKFQISVAFITKGGIQPLLLTLKELEQKNIPGEILTTNYLNFTEPDALKILDGLSNITIKMYDVDAAGEDFHTKGYIFKKDEIYRIIIGSSNLTGNALTSNREWNTKLVSSENGEMTQNIISEFNELWDSKYSLPYEEFIDEYSLKYKIIKHQRDTAKKEKVVSWNKYNLEPNSMQVGFVSNLKKIITSGQNKALLISATGTGKTYASAYAMLELGYKRVLFIAHRMMLIDQAIKSYKNIFGDDITMGRVGGGFAEYNADYVFAMVETLHKEENLKRFSPEEFDCIILDEAHHSPANTYQKVMDYFKPKLFLGMTATPDKRDDNIEGRNVYELFDHQIAYEIRFQKAMEDDLLCTFHYYGISDIMLLNDAQLNDNKLSQDNFNKLTSDERVRHIIKQAEYFGYSGDRVKGLVFCNKIAESKMLSEKFNNLGYRTISLDGSDNPDKRKEAFERLAMDEKDATDEVTPLDYIFSVNILNEGVDIIEVNQVIMLRPTDSPIVFIQQLGRGLRKAPGKEYVVVLDFIGNYNNNFMIPVALSGDRTYNKDTIRKYVISGNNVIPGASTVHFDEISKERIFRSIDKLRGIRTIISDSYKNLKDRLGKEPMLYDFYMHGEIDPLLIVKVYKTYWQFMENVANKDYSNVLTEHEKTILEYLSKTILSGVKPNELMILKELFDNDYVSANEIKNKLKFNYDYIITDNDIDESARILQGCFVTKDEEYQKYKVIDILNYDKKLGFRRLSKYVECLRNDEFSAQIKDIINVGLARYSDIYSKAFGETKPFILYEKYTRRDVCLLMNCDKDLTSVMNGMKRIGDDVFVFVTYHKEEAKDGRNYIEGKPDYDDAFEDNLTFRWDSQIGKGEDSSYMKDVINAKRKHLFVKKNDKEHSLYYMGLFEIEDIQYAKKENLRGEMKDISKVKMKMHHPVRDDLLRYLQSDLSKEVEEKMEA